MKIGLNLNGVVVPYHDNQPRNQRELNKTKPIPGAIEGIKTLVERFGANQIFIILACRPDDKGVALNWLTLHDIYDRTGLAREGQVVFCRKGKDIVLFAKKRGLHLFGDNRADTLSDMENKVAKRCLFGPQTKEPDDTGIILTPTWEDLLDVALS